MADRFDVVAVEVTQKDRVVGRVVLRPQPGLVQDLRVCGDGSGMDTVDRRAVRSGERHVHLVERGTGRRAQPEVREAVRSRQPDDR
jgi:hypothetical protein